MANNTISIDFEGCEPAPGDGYKIFYRPIGSEIDYREAPQNFLESPAEWTDTLDPLNTIYEGYIQGDCGGGKLGPAVTFVTEFGGGSGSGGSGGSDSGAENAYSISYTNNQEIPIQLRIHNNGIGGPLIDIYNGDYDTDPVAGTSPELPAVDALVVFSIGGGKSFVSVSCNGVPDGGAVGGPHANWDGVNGPIEIVFITD